jgi:hypothetical protein|tara:strand:+ start:1497 stop:1622 length:126 start_codon:yes stop_codon:yes gene_type:complete
MSDSWNENEIKDTVFKYLKMVDAEDKGQKLNKSKIYRELHN